MKRRMWSLAVGLVCAGMTLSVQGHAGWAPQRAQAVPSMSALDLAAFKKPITKRFVNAKLSEVLAWLSLEKFSFVADVSEFPEQGQVTLNFQAQPLGAVLDAIADAYHGRWERRGDIFTLRSSVPAYGVLGGPAIAIPAPARTRGPEAPAQVSISGTARTVPAPVAVGQGLTDTLAVLGGKARARGVRVSIRVADRLPTIEGFGGELNQVWANLIANAIEAAPPSGQVEVTAEARDGEVVVRVVDDGPGIPEAIREKIFDPFFTTKPQGEGTGLGLDITQRLVREHGGRIELESRPGRTEFRVTLPRATVST